MVFTLVSEVTDSRLSSTMPSHIFHTLDYSISFGSIFTPLVPNWSGFALGVRAKQGKMEVVRRKVE